MIQVAFVIRNENRVFHFLVPVLRVILDNPLVRNAGLKRTYDTADPEFHIKGSSLGFKARGVAKRGALLHARELPEAQRVQDGRSD